MIDDNPVERRLISDKYPQVQVLDPTQPQTCDALELMLAFPNTTQTEGVFAAIGERRPVRGLFLATERNEPASTLFEKAGFTHDEATGYWTLAAGAELPAVPDWLTVSSG